MTVSEELTCSFFFFYLREGKLYLSTPVFKEKLVDATGTTRGPNPQSEREREGVDGGGED